MTLPVAANKKFFTFSFWRHESEVTCPPNNDGGSKHHWNVGQLLRDYMAKYRTRLLFSEQISTLHRK